MATSAAPVAPTAKSTAERMFPSFTPAQIARVANHGKRRPIERGEILFEAGVASTPFFVVASGQVEIVRPAASGGELVAVHGPGQFTGEVNMLAGAALTGAGTGERGRAKSSKSTASGCSSLVQTDAEISEILMRAFILRRVELIARGLGDVIVIGSQPLQRNAAREGVPHSQRSSLHVHRP